jgi:hypothetical protein
MTDTFDSVSETVMRLSVEKLQDNFRNRFTPNIYVVPPDSTNIYVGFKPMKKSDSDTQPTELHRYNYRDVVSRVEEVFGKNVQVSSDIRAETSLIVAPDRWDRKLPLKFAKYAGNLDAIPFSVVLHAGQATTESYKKLIPPKNALSIMRSNKALKLLDMSNMIVNMPVSGHRLTSHSGLHFQEPNDLPPDFAEGNFQWYTANAKNRKTGKLKTKKTRSRKTNKSTRSRSLSRARSIARSRDDRGVSVVSDSTSRKRHSSRNKVAQSNYERLMRKMRKIRSDYETGE